MREIAIGYNELRKTYLIADLHGNTAFDCKTSDDIINYFNKDPIGIQLKNRKHLNIKIDLESIAEENIPGLRNTLNLIHWNKANINYVNLQDYVKHTRKTHG